MNAKIKIMCLKNIQTHNKMSLAKAASVKRQKNGSNLYVNRLDAAKTVTRISFSTRLISPFPKGLRALCRFTTVNHQQLRVEGARGLICCKRHNIDTDTTQNKGRL